MSDFKPTDENCEAFPFTIGQALALILAAVAGFASRCGGTAGTKLGRIGSGFSRPGFSPATNTT